MRMMIDQRIKPRCNSLARGRPSSGTINAMGGGNVNRSLMGSSLEAGTGGKPSKNREVVLVFIVDNFSSVKNTKLVEKTDDCCNVFQIALWVLRNVISSSTKSQKKSVKILYITHYIRISIKITYNIYYWDTLSMNYNVKFSNLKPRHLFCWILIR